MVKTVAAAAAIATTRQVRELRVIACLSFCTELGVKRPRLLVRTAQNRLSTDMPLREISTVSVDAQSSVDAASAAPHTVQGMLQPVDPSQTPPPASYRVPWSVVRDDSTHPVVVNASAEATDFVRVFHEADGSTRETTQLWGQVLPAERIELCLCDADLDEVIVTLAWFRQSDGLEYLWRFVV